MVEDKPPDKLNAEVVSPDPDLGRDDEEDLGAGSAGTERVILRQTIRSEIRRELRFFSGPLPPPDALAEYERIFPGCAKRIVDMADRQSQHRQSLEKRSIFSNTRNETLGQILAAVITLVTISGSIYLAAIGKELTGFGIILTNITALAGVFVYGRYQQKEERKEKNEALIESTQKPLTIEPSKGRES
jgi:uncharacterized membrane protein